MLEYHHVGNGCLIWRYGRYRGEIADNPVGTTGEWRFRLEGVSYSCAKVVWFLETGEWPKFRLRYLNQDRDDIRICNLEETHRRDGPGR